MRTTAVGNLFIFAAGCAGMGDAATLEELGETVAAFVARREWEAFHNPKDLALALSVEAAELLEIFRWKGREEVGAALPALREAIADELADVLIYALSMANAASIDLTEAVQGKLNRNEARFPVEEYRGRAEREDEAG